MKRSRVASVLLTLWSMAGHAADIEGHLVGEELQWRSATSVAGGITPALWDLPINLPTGSSVIPGGVQNAQPPLTLHGPDGVAVQVPLSISGIEYRLSSVSGQKPVTGTAHTTISGDMAQTLGTGTGDVNVDLSHNEAPFTHYRPVLNPIDAAALAQAFKQAQATQGRYSGNVNITVPYDYYRDGVRVRNTLVMPLHVVIDYQPATLNDIQVQGDGVIAAEYHGYKKVSGHTMYTVTATGNFPNGVLMGLQPPTDGQFHLTSTEPDSGEINYNLTCVTGCDTQQLIVNGVAKIDNSDHKATILAPNPTQAQARLKVDFNNQPMDTLKSGTYRDTFVLMFEAGL